MQINSKAESVPSPASSSTSSKTATKTKSSKTPDPTVAADLQDTFTQQTQEDQERHFKMEHVAKLHVQERLHKAKIATLFAQLQTQLASLWNDVWMQRQKVHEEAFKSWLKLLLS